MLKNWSTHADYEQFIISNLSCLYKTFPKKNILLDSVTGIVALAEFRELLPQFNISNMFVIPIFIPNCSLIIKLLAKLLAL